MFIPRHVGSDRLRVHRPHPVQHTVQRTAPVERGANPREPVTPTLKLSLRRQTLPQWAYVALHTYCVQGADAAPVHLAKGIVMEESGRPKWMRSTKGAPFTGIGSLEADILAVVWQYDQTTVRVVYETLLERRQIAYTTVMTVMNNLVKKHLLVQDRSHIAYVYSPAIPGREVVQTVLESVVARLLTGQYNVAVSQLLKLDRELTPDETTELRAWVRERFDA